MSDSAGTRYLALYKAEKNARDKFLAIEQTIREVSKTLSEDPSKFSFENVATGNTHRRSPTILVDAKKWPTADQVQAALTAWLTVREECEHFWGQMTGHEREGLSAPIGYEEGRLRKARQG